MLTFVMDQLKSSIFSWFHIGKPKTDGYFVLSNLKIIHEEKHYNGLAIKLIDSLLILGDGQILRHGTTVTEFLGTIFGIQFAANAISMTSTFDLQK